MKYHLWRGRVHCTLASDDAVKKTKVVRSDLSSKELARLRRGVFYGRSPGDAVTVRVVKIRERLVQK